MPDARNDLIFRGDAAKIIADMVASCKSDIICDVAKQLDAIPAADAAPVVHGRWIKPKDSTWTLGHCSVCGKLCVETHTAIFCPNCGAKMDADACGPDYCEI